MKILIVTTISVTMNFFEEQIKDLINSGNEVHLASNFNQSYSAEVNQNVIMHQIDFSRSITSKKNLKAFKQLKRLFSSVDFDIIHTHTPIASALVRLQSNKNSQIIYTAHGFHFFKGAPKKNWLMYYPLEYFLSRKTDKLITINSEDYFIAKKKFKMKKLYLVNGPGVNYDDIEKEPIVSREELGLHETDFVLVFGAELNENKNQKLLIDTMKILLEKYQNIKLLLVGTDNNNGKYQEYVNNIGLSNNVIFLGQRQDLKGIIKSCDLAVSSSKREGLGLFLIESLICGLPLVATDNRGSREIIIDGQNGFISKFNTEDFANKIEKIYLDSKLFPKLIDNPKSFYYKFLDNRIIHMLDEVYKEDIN